MGFNLTGPRFLVLSAGFTCCIFNFSQPRLCGCHASYWRQDSQMERTGNELTFRVVCNIAHKCNRIQKLINHKQHMLNYVIVLRILPFPPNWVVNLGAPHLQVPASAFFWGTFIGIAKSIKRTVWLNVRLTRKNEFNCRGGSSLFYSRASRSRFR